MRRIASFLTATLFAATAFALSPAAVGAQSDGDLEAFCRDRIAANGAEGKKANLAIMNEMVDVAPADVVSQITELRDAYRKKGDRLFESEKGLTLLGALDGWIYDHCPGQQVAVTAMDYEYEGVPDVLPAGPVKFRLTNEAPKESHELGIVRLTDAAEGTAVEDLLALPEKKQAKYFDFSSAAFTFAPPGQSGYTPMNLEPGTYAYACFLPVGGKKHGAPHFTEGMYGTFTVE